MTKPSGTKTTTKRAPRKPSTPRTPRVPANAEAPEPRDNPGTGQEGSAPERTPEAENGQASPPAVEGPAEPEVQSEKTAPDSEDFDPRLDGGEDAEEIFGDEAHGETQEPSPDPAAGKVEEPAPDPAAVPSEPPAPEPQQGDSNAVVEQVQLGGVVGTQRLVPLRTVQAVVGRESTNHAAGLRSPVVSDLMKRWPATDGRCAPMIFTHPDPTDSETKEAPKLFAGLESMAAAMALGKDAMFVIIIASGDASRAQSAIAAKMHQPKTSDDDELMWRLRD